MREGWRRMGEKEGDVISPGMSLGSLQVGVKLGDERSDFNYELAALLSIAFRINPKMSSVYWNRVWSECFFLHQTEVVFLSPVVPWW